MSIFDDITEYGLTVFSPSGVIAQSELPTIKVGYKITSDYYMYDLDLWLIDPFGNTSNILVNDVFQSGWGGTIIGNDPSEPDEIMVYVDKINYNVITPGYVYDFGFFYSFAAVTP